MAEPVAFTVTRYRCPHCQRFTASRKRVVAEHIARCWHDPAQRTCKTCAHHAQAHTSAPAEWCFPGAACTCNDMDEHCEHPDGPDEFVSVTVGCPFWELRQKDGA
jgi:hypothetical protein